METIESPVAVDAEASDPEIARLLLVRSEVAEALAGVDAHIDAARQRLRDQQIERKSSELDK